MSITITLSWIQLKPVIGTRIRWIKGSRRNNGRRASTELLELGVLVLDIGTIHRQSDQIEQKNRGPTVVGANEEVCTL